MDDYIDAAELSRHNSKSSCWIVIHGQVWDVTGKPVHINFRVLEVSSVLSFFVNVMQSDGFAAS